MDQILGLFKEMTPFQWVLIGVGVVVLWPYISQWFSQKPSPDSPTPPPIPDDYDLTDMVKRWESLYDVCEMKGLTDACTKLKEVFPMLVEVNNTKE